MKVCFIGGTRYSCPLDTTSAKKFQTLTALVEIFVIGFSHDLKPRRFVEHACFYLLPQWPLPILRYLTMFLAGPWLALWLILRHGVKILVAQSPYEGFAAALAKKISDLFGRKVVLVVESHGDFEESLFLQRRISWKGLYRFLMHQTARFSLEHADLLRAVSNSTRIQLERWAPGKPIVQFPAWTDIEAFFEAGATNEKTANAIAFVGVLIPRKGVHFLIEAFSKVVQEFPETQLWLIGKAENKEYAQSLKGQVTRLGLEGRILFTDPMPQRDLAQHMAHARVLVLPSLSEGLPRVVFEAMAAGTPVIASRVSGIPEMVKDGINGFLVPPGDVEALAERLRWVLSHPEEAKQMGRQAREFAQKFFSPQAYREGYAKLFRLAEEISQKGGYHASSTF